MSLTDSENATSEPPAKKTKVEQSSSENDFLTNLSTAAAVQEELDSYMTSTDGGSQDLTCSILAWKGHLAQVKHVC